MVLFALCMMTETAATGAILQMLSHGLMTALFFAVIGMIYHQAGTRDVRYLGGLMKIIPFLSVGYAVPKHRAHIAALLKEYGCDTLEGYLNVTHALSLNDTFWVRAADVC